MSLSKNPLVAIIMGSKTDLKVMQAAEDALTEFKISFITKIVSAHRTPEEMFDFSKKAHLQGIVACLTPLPVIGVPVTVGGLKGIDALLSIAQMPKGVPVATVAVDNAYNAGLLAVRILGLKNINLSKKIESHQKKQKLKVKSMNAELKKKKK